MSKTTLFIAVQCYECSTMQVKQQKKSSNKWSCAVCNEKQSVRRVYAQGYQAKDIRQVVQSFNMSRKFADDVKFRQSESSLGHFVEQECGKGMAEENNMKRWSDWSEYVDVDAEGLEPAYLRSMLQEDQTLVHRVVTELPEESLFKKPKLKGNYASSSLKSGETRTYNPQFSKRSENSAVTNELMEPPPNSSNVASAKNEFTYKVSDGDHPQDIRSGLQKRAQKTKGGGMMKTSTSRWAEYLNEDNGYHFKGNKSHSTDDLRLGDGYKVQTNDEDELLEEDIHPDFM